MAKSKEEYVPNYSEPRRKKVAPKALIEKSAEETDQSISTVPEGTVPTDADTSVTETDPNSPV